MSEPTNFFVHGGRWVRADFHLHTRRDREFKDSGAEQDFVPRYIEALKSADIRVGVITNHNKFDRDEFKALRKAAKKEDIYLMPGIELSVKDGRNGIHTLVMFHEDWIDNQENADHINSFLNVTFARQTNFDNKNARSNHDLLETIRELDKFEKDYLLVFAHVEADKAVSFVGNDPAGTQYRDSEDIKGCLHDLHKNMMSFLTRNMRRIQGDKGINTEGELEIPTAALEELVVNMLLHRDYFISAPWRIFMFDNRIELTSPGSLPNNLTIENIRNGVSVVRNPLLASFGTKELPYRGIGTGIRRALAAVPTLKLESDHDRNLFTATIPRTA